MKCDFCIAPLIGDAFVRKEHILHHHCVKGYDAAQAGLTIPCPTCGTTGISILTSEKCDSCLGEGYLKGPAWVAPKGLFIEQKPPSLGSRSFVCGKCLQTCEIDLVGEWPRPMSKCCHHPTVSDVKEYREEKPVKGPRIVGDRPMRMLSVECPNCFSKVEFVPADTTFSDYWKRHTIPCPHASCKKSNYQIKLQEGWNR